MKLLTAICVAALVVAFSVPAFAETQNIKISGDIKIASVIQRDIDLNDTDNTFLAPGLPAPIAETLSLLNSNENDNQNFFVQQVGLNVEADLTDNVSTFVRIINERDWNAAEQHYSEIDALGVPLSFLGTGSQDAWDITLDEAYVTLKQMLYCPLTVKIGRQNIWLGKGFIMGNSGPDGWDNQGGLNPTIREISGSTAFDAIRATLDYCPWTIDLIYSKLAADYTSNLVTFASRIDVPYPYGSTAANLTNDDVDLYVANVGYKFSCYDAEAEAYYAMKSNKRLADGRSEGIPAFVAGSGTVGDSNDTHTIGLRGSFVPFDNMNIWAEGAYQGGTYATITREVDRQAWAMNLGGDYTFATCRYTPVLGLEYIYLSGEDVDGTGAASGDWNAWDPMYRGKFDNYIADFRNITKITDYDLFNGTAFNSNNHGMTNQHQVGIIGSIKPMCDVTLDARFAFLWYDESPIVDGQEQIGNELDVKLAYDYTEDVEFALCAGAFFAGDFFPGSETWDLGADVGLAPGLYTKEFNPDKTAIQIVTSVSVDF